ncbi:MAG: potassium-transporting ATPase subunit F [Alphaproteobacteria bacterium]|nr:MAG: potassium-transporting ATPase subunit F [Alphaproteobacteria bacterium]
MLVPSRRKAPQFKRRACHMLFDYFIFIVLISLLAFLFYVLFKPERF